MLGIEPHAEGLPKKRFNECVDKYLETGKLNPEIISFMSSYQQSVINEIKKSIKRIKAKYAKELERNNS